MPDEVQTPPRLIEHLDDKESYWKFWVIGRRTVIGRIVDYLVTTVGIPITIMVEPDGHAPVEIPWSSIQYVMFIQQEGRDT